VEEIKEVKEVKEKTNLTQRHRERKGSQREEKPKSTVRNDCATRETQEPV